jgi:hypothetical protein
MEESVMKIKSLKMRWIVVVVFAFSILVSGATAHAALKTFGPPTPATMGFPAWYQDLAGVSLGPCWDFNGFCTLLPPFCPPSLGLGCIGTPINLNPAVPITATNFPIETFYFAATTNISVGPAGGAKFVQVISLEGSFGGLPVLVAPGNQITFLRINTRVTGLAGSLVPNATYTVLTPYNTYTFAADATGAPLKPLGVGAFRALDGCAAAPCDFSLLIPATTTGVGPFLQDANGLHTDPATGSVYVGAGPLSAVPVIGSPLGALRNNVTITGPSAGGAGINTITNPFFFLCGKVVGITASPNPVAFPVQKAGVTSAPVTVTITNPDAVNAVTLGTLAVTGANAADFTVTPGTCSTGAVIPVAGGTCTFTVTFSEPTATAVNGAKSALVTFPVTAPLNKPPVIINFSGAIDKIPPTVTATIPANGDINVPANNALTATFSEPVTGVSNTTFTLAGPTGDVAGAVVMDPANTVATFTPTIPALQSDKTYTATISTVVTDLVGNALAPFTFSFVTTAPNTNPPAVISTDPADNTTGAGVNDPITATFNAAIQVSPLAITATTFFLSEGVTGNVTWDPVTRTATLRPDKPLEFFHKYIVKVTTGVKSLGGIPMAADFTWSFLTNGAPSAPSLHLPEDGATGVALPVQFQWLKSKDIDAESVTYHLWFCTNPGYLGCTPVDIASSTTTTATASSASFLRNTLAGLGGYGAGMLLAGFAIAGGVRSRRKIFFFIAVLAISVMAATACGKKTETVSVPVAVDQSTLMSKSISDLKSQTTYYWKVVADDGNGALIESETRSFTTL